MAYLVPVLSSWLLTGILDHTPVQSAYSNACLSKRFVAHNNDTCLLPWTPLVRILCFTSTTPAGELVAVFHDAAHKIVARFSREAVRRFELRYGQRLTYETNARLLVLRHASLRFVGFQERADFARALASMGALNAAVALVYLDVKEVEFYVRDRILLPVLAEYALVPLYKDAEYVERFRKSSPADVAHNEELISDEESLPNPD